MAVRSLAAWLCLIVAAPVLAQAASDDDMITPNYKDVDIRQVVETVSDITGQNFLLDARVKGNVTMISETPMTREAFYETFLSILEVYGFVAVPSGDIVKIIPDTNARQVPGPSGGSTSLRGDDIVTEVIRVNNVGAAQLVPILRPLVPQYGHLAAHPASNMLIIADRAANVRRLKNIIRRIDQSTDEDIEVIPMQHATASEVVRIMSTLNQSAQRGGDTSTTPLSLVADERTNSVLISGDKSQRLRFRTLITHLDTPLEEGGNTQVVYLRYANAEELATKLTEQVRGSTATTGGAQGTQAQQSQNPIIIWADPGTNALIITAPPKVMRNLRQVIDKIDIRRAQVHVEAVLVEVLGDNSADLGITWILDGSDKGPFVGFTNFANAPSAIGYAGALLSDNPAQAVGELAAGSNGFTVGGGRFKDEGTNFGAILNALEAGGDTNVLSTPSIVTLDNEEAEINIGEEVPFLTGSFSNTGGVGSVNPFQTIQRQDVGVKLKITPQINEGDAVILDIEFEASSVAESGEAVDLITTQRQITQRVIVDDGGVIVLGGLIDDFLSESESGVPVLSKIPVLGALFRSRSTTYRKRNLMVFIRPKIIRDRTQAAFETNAKYNYVRNLQLAGDDVQLIPGTPRPVLPTLEDFEERGFVDDEEALEPPR